MGGAQQAMGPAPGSQWAMQYQQQLQNFGGLGQLSAGAIASMTDEQFMGFMRGPRGGDPYWAVQWEAHKTAEALLVRHLTDEQRASWEKHKGFWATAKSGNRYWLDGRRPRGLPLDGPPQAYCVDALDEEGRNLPTCDKILAHKLLIETDEEKFLKTANASRL